MFVVNLRKFFFALSGILVAGSIGAMVYFGLPFGIDFNGGTLIEVSYHGERPSTSLITETLVDRGFTGTQVQPTGDTGYIIRTSEVDAESRQVLLRALSFEETFPYTEERFNAIGPVIGEELRSKAWIALASVIIAIILFIAFTFRKVSQPVSSWKYGVIAIVALLHDIIIPTGVFAVLGNIFLDYQIDVLFVTALLAILGFSVNDTIVVFDRIRENLRLNREGKVREDFKDTVGKSLKQTYARSINTSLTTLIVLVALFVIGGASTQPFALTLAIGVVAGTYSSIFLASPLLVAVEGASRGRAKKEGA